MLTNVLVLAYCPINLPSDSFRPKMHRERFRSHYASRPRSDSDSGGLKNESNNEDDNKDNANDSSNNNKTNLHLIFRD